MWSVDVLADSKKIISVELEWMFITHWSRSKCIVEVVESRFARTGPGAKFVHDVGAQYRTTIYISMHVYMYNYYSYYYSYARSIMFIDQ